MSSCVSPIRFQTVLSNGTAQCTKTAALISVTTTDQMRHHMGVLTHNVARPMSIMNSFMP